MTNPLRILVVEPDDTRARAIADVLAQDGTCRATILGQTTGLARRVAALAPDLVLIDAGSPSRDALEELALASSAIDRPVAMFVDTHDPDLMRAAVQAGVSAYVAHGVDAARLRPVIDLAIAQFGQMQRLRAELEETRRVLEERKVIDRAKGILMQAKGLTEDAAYALLRKTAMDQKRKLADVAAALVTAAGLLS
jgi:two-component system, response regulator / RNA-binding antiterminator